MRLPRHRNSSLYDTPGGHPYWTQVRRMLFWRKVQTVILWLLIFSPWLVYGMAPRWVAYVWTCLVVLFVTAHQWRVYHRKNASKNYDNNIDE